MEVTSNVRNDIVYLFKNVPNEAEDFFHEATYEAIAGNLKPFSILSHR